MSEAKQRSTIQKTFPDGVPEHCPDLIGVNKESWEMLVMHVNLGMTYAEIANDVGKAKSSVYSSVGAAGFVYERHMRNKDSSP